MLTRIVAWWSVFTMLTGVVAGYPALLGVRFYWRRRSGRLPERLAGDLEVVLPGNARAGIRNLHDVQPDRGGLSPLVVLPIQDAFGWRAAFYVFGSAGFVWAVVWFAHFRDFPDGSGAPIARRETGDCPPMLRSHLFSVFRRGCRTVL